MAAPKGVNPKDILEWYSQYLLKHQRKPYIKEISAAFGISYAGTVYWLQRIGISLKPDTESKVYYFYVEYWQQNQKAPTLIEVGKALGITHSAVYLHIVKLVDKGLLEFDPHKTQRGVRVKGLDNAPQSHTTI